MVKVKNWIDAMRLRTLPLALASIGTGSFLAAFDHRFKGSVFALSCLTTLLLQILSNLANDYGDFVNGADHEEREGPSRAVQSGSISPKSMRVAIVLLAVASLVSGMGLLYVSIGFGSPIFYLFLFLGLGAIVAAVKYTMGKNPYGYAGLGDLFVLIFFGIVGVLGSYYLHTEKFNATYILPAISVGLLSTGVLNVNNIRDIESDSKVGKKSIPVRIGRKNAVLYHWSILGAAFAMSLIFTLLHFESIVQLAFILTVPLFLKNAIAVNKFSVPRQLDPYLKQLALSSLVYILLFGIGLLF